VVLPQKSAEGMLKGREAFNPLGLFRLNLAGIDEAAVVLAILDEADADSGTSWECGYAFKTGCPIIGLRTDIRRAADDPNASVNLMLSQSCKRFIQVPLDRLDDFPWLVRKISEGIREALQ
jgi:nucleoside 2-deoxyribosyltransferase